MWRSLSFLALTAIFTSTAFAQNPFEELHSFTVTTSDRYDMHAVVTEVDIGNYKTVKSQALVICPTGTADLNDAKCNASYKRTGNANDLGGILIDAKQGDTIDVNLINELPAHTSMNHCMDGHGWDNSDGWVANYGLVNLHTHGLLVKPYGRETTDGVSTYGDYVYDCTQQGVTAETIFPSMHYKIAIPADTTQPSGMNWFHPHVHGIAKAQVSSGMAGMLAVGAPQDYLCLSPDNTANPPTCNDKPDAFHNIQVRNMLLRDAQIVQLGTSLKWLNHADETPDFCEPDKISEITGECKMRGDLTVPDSDLAGSTLVPSDGRWVYTINGVQYPEWSLETGKTGEIWRLQNASANITYLLSLRLVGEGMKRKFQVLSMDGAGLAPGAKSTELPGAIEEILLMPGSRADIYVDGGKDNSGNVCSAAIPCPKEDFQLVTAAYQAGFAPDDADTWPQISLAKFSLPDRTIAGSLLSLRIPPSNGSRNFSSSVRATDAEKVTAIMKNCMDVPDDKTAATYLDLMTKVQGGNAYRRVYFGIAKDGAGNEAFLLGNTIVEGNTEMTPAGVPINADNPVELRQASMTDDKANLCVLFGEGTEKWELINVSKEVHNFHIHQMKFSVESDTKKWRTPSDLDLQQLPNSIVLNSGKYPLLHDTIVVPRGYSNCALAINTVRDNTVDPPTVRFLLDPTQTCNGSERSVNNTSGMLPISLSFNGAYLQSPVNKPAKFPFHCHILEHEDLGMMAKIAVIGSDPIMSP
jgi:FtsP/CotA-like multicopper oxidase with cupredoxin domain